MMRNIKLTIEYDGTNFQGWQIQKQNNRTVQGQIERALKLIFRKRIKLTGSGRTDSGVHAFGQVANFKVTSRLTDKEIQKALNANLPEDVTILKSEEVPLTFHAQYSAKRKTYRYCILNRRVRCAQQRDYCLHVPYKINLKKMREEAKALVGRKDFRAFMAMDAAQRNTIKEKNTVRTVSRLEIRKKKDFLYIEIEANGFLYKMVRNMVGTLLEISTKNLPKGSMGRILQAKTRNSAGDTAPAQGLCLVNVTY